MSNPDFHHGVGSISKGSSKQKQRKPYTITKPRESWTDGEHRLFVEALKMFERDWKKIEGHVKTKTVIQIRSHAQKYFIKMQKSGKDEMIPPPRPKRRSKKPYPKSGDRLKKSDYDGHDSGFGSVIRQDYNSTPQNPYPYGTVAGLNTQPALRAMIPQPAGPSLQWAMWERQQLAELQQEQLSQAQYYLQQAISAHTSEQKGSDPSDASKKPNFQRIYSFLGSLFDPSTSGHVGQLRSMDEMDRQVVQLLMQNLASNLSKHHTVSHDFNSAKANDSAAVEATIEAVARPTIHSMPGADMTDLETISTAKAVDSSGFETHHQSNPGAPFPNTLGATTAGS